MTMIGHISREEVAPEPDQQEWTLALSFVQDRDTRKCLEKAHNASLDKERERADHNSDVADSIARASKQVEDSLRTQLATVQMSLTDLARASYEAQKPLVEALNFYAHGGGGIHIATEALTKIGGK